jgi:hypothetical protein
MPPYDAGAGATPVSSRTASSEKAWSRCAVPPC